MKKKIGYNADYYAVNSAKEHRNITQPTGQHGPSTSKHIATLSNKNACSWHTREVTAGPTRTMEIDETGAVMVAVSVKAFANLAQNKKTVTVTLQSGASTVAALKTALSRKTGVPPSQQQIRRCGLETTPVLTDSDDVVHLNGFKDIRSGGDERKTDAKKENTNTNGEDEKKDKLNSVPIAMSMVVVPLDSSVLMRRTKNFKRFITFDAWKLDDAKVLIERNLCRVRQREEAAVVAANRRARNQAAFAAWASKLKREQERIKIFAPGSPVELAIELNLDLFAPTLSPAVLPASSSLEGEAPTPEAAETCAAAVAVVGAPGASVTKFRMRRVSTTDLLTVVCVAKSLEAAKPTAKPSATDVNWYVVRTKDGWLAEVPARHLVLPRRPPLSADEQYLADADERRRPAHEVLQDRAKWENRHEWRNLTKPTASKRRGSAVAVAGTEAAALQRDLGEAAWMWFIKRLDGRRLRPRTLFHDVDKAGRGSISHSELRQGLSDSRVLLSDEDFSAICKDLDPKDEGAIERNAFIRILALRKRMHGGHGDKDSSAKVDHGSMSHSKMDSATRASTQRNVASEDCSDEIAAREAFCHAAFEEWLKKKRRDDAVRKKMERINTELKANEQKEAKVLKWKKKSVVSAYSTAKAHLVTRD